MNMRDVAGLSRCSKEVGETVLVTSREHTHSCLFRMVRSKVQLQVKC